MKVVGGARVVGHVGREVDVHDDVMARYRRAQFELAVTKLPAAIATLTKSINALVAELRARRTEGRE